MRTVRSLFFKVSKTTVGKKSRADRERGYVLVILAILIGVLLSFAGLAIDTGRLYQIKAKIERAAREAALAGVKHRVQRGWFYIYDGPDSAGPTWTNGIKDPKGPHDRINEVLMSAYRVLTQNMKAAGLDVSTDSLKSPKVLNCPEYAQPGFDDADWASISNCTFDGITFDAVTDTVTVTVKYNAPTFLAGRVPATTLSQSCLGGHCEMNFVADAQLQPALIGLIIDVSGSMRCAFNGGNADTCDSTATYPNRKIDKLVDASKAFYKMFNPFHDFIGVIPFNLVAAPAASGANVDATFGADAARWKKFKKLLTASASDPDSNDGSGNNSPGLTPASNTNHCDALWEARNRLASRTVPSGEKFFVFFTDGAPTAARFSFLNENTDNRDKSFEQLGLDAAGQSNDYFLYSVEWRDTSTNPPTVFTGPGPLIHNTKGGGGLPVARGELYNYPVGQNGKIFPVKQNGDPAVVPITPKEYLKDASLYSNPSTFREILKYGVDKNFGFVMPNSYMPPKEVANDDNTNSLDIDVNDVDPVPAGNSPYYQQLFYHCTLEAAHLIRQSDGTIFAIGLGQSVPRAAFKDSSSNSGSQGDPYGDHNNQWARKDDYLRMVAKDDESGGDYSFGASPNRNANKITIPTEYLDELGHNQESTHSHKGLKYNVGFKRGNQIASSTVRPGAYFGTNNANDLTDIFVGIAKRILSRVGA